MITLFMQNMQLLSDSTITIFFLTSNIPKVIYTILAP